MVSLNDLPGVARPAIQQGTYIRTRVIHTRLAGETEMPPFAYRDKGNIGPYRPPVGRRGLLRDGVHRHDRLHDVGIHPRVFLIGWGNRLATMLNWARALTFTKNRPHRTITFERAQDELTQDTGKQAYEV